jgi:hypothetical protein
VMAAVAVKIGDLRKARPASFNSAYISPSLNTSLLIHS